jgi:hypothetical protein
MKDKAALLQHFLAALAYRTQKALRGSAESFPAFRVAPGVRSPHELLHHMDSVLGYAQTFFVGGTYHVPILPSFPAEIERFHATLTHLARLVAETTDWSRISHEQLLQGPLSDAMSHAGQLALMRRLSGDPVPPENFVFADVASSNLSASQPLPVAPDSDWPEGPLSGSRQEATFYEGPAGK